MSSFIGTCEKCFGKTPARGNGRVLCDTCKPETTVRQLRARARKPLPARTGPCCDNCGHRTCRKHQRLDSNLRPAYALLCTTCGIKLGYRPLSYGRPFYESKGREHLRGAA